MRGTFSFSQLVVAAQSGLLLLLVLLLAGPIPPPTVFGLDVQLSWTILCLVAAALICLPALLSNNGPSTPLDWFVGIYLLIVGLTTIGSVDRFATMRAATTLVAEFGVFYATVIVVGRTPRLAPAIVGLVIVAIAIVQLMAFGYHLEFGPRLRPKEYPIPAGWAGYPELGALATLQFGLLVGMFQAGRRPLEIAGAAGLVLIAAGEILFLESRTAWAAAAVVLAAGLIFSGPRFPRMLLGGAVVIAMAGVLYLSNPTVRVLADNLLKDTVAGGSGDPMIEIASRGARLKLWRETADMIADSPVHGVGLGNFRSVFEADYNPELNDDERRGVHAHNLWLQQAAELGIPGGLAFVALWIAGLGVAWQGTRRRAGPVSAGVLLALLGTTASNSTDNVPYLMAGLRVYFLTWIVFGLAVASAGSPAAPATVETTS